MVRAHVQFNTTQEVADFVNQININDTTNKYIITNGNGNFTVDARSLLGVIYMMSDYNDHCYLINQTNDGYFPSYVDKYRKP